MEINTFRHSNYACDLLGTNKNSLSVAKNIDKQNHMSNYFNLPFIIPQQRHRTLSLVSHSNLKNSQKSNQTQTTIFNRLQTQAPQQGPQLKLNEQTLLKKGHIQQPKVAQNTTPVEGQNKTSRGPRIKNYTTHIQQFRSKMPPEPEQVQIDWSSDNEQTYTNYSPLPKNKIKNNRAKTLSFEDTQQQFQLNLQKQSKKKTKKRRRLKLKVVFLFVRATVRFSKKYRKLWKLQEKHFQYVGKYRQLDIRNHHKKFVSTISNKIFLFTKSRQYDEECQSVWYQEENQVTQDIRRTRYCGLSFMFLQNLELLTRKENLPKLITYEMIYSLFASKNTTTSQFVLNRCNFYQKKVLELSSNEKILIAVEFFLFEVITPSLIELGNDLEKFDLALINQTQHYLIGIISVLQLLFTNYFQGMNLIQKQIHLKRQKVLNVTNQKETGYWKLQIETNTKVEKDETIIIAGCFPKEVMAEICSNKKSWTQKIQKIFQQIVQNLQTQIIV